MIWGGKRGEGVTTGHGAVMGVSTGKVMAYSTRCKNCRVCDNAKKMKQSQENTTVSLTTRVHLKAWSLM